MAVRLLLLCLALVCGFGTAFASAASSSSSQTSCFPVDRLCKRFPGAHVHPDVVAHRMGISPHSDVQAKLAAFLSSIQQNGLSNLPGHGSPSDRGLSLTERSKLLQTWMASHCTGELHNIDPTRLDSQRSLIGELVCFDLIRASAERQLCPSGPQSSFSLQCTRKFNTLITTVINEEGSCMVLSDQPNETISDPATTKTAGTDLCGYLDKYLNPPPLQIVRRQNPTRVLAASPSPSATSDGDDMVITILIAGVSFVLVLLILISTICYVSYRRIKRELDDLQSANAAVELELHETRSKPAVSTFAKKWVVNKPYRAARGDEMDLRVGDIVTLLSVFNDGWGHGHNETTNVVGTLPLSSLVPQKVIKREPVDSSISGSSSRKSMSHRSSLGTQASLTGGNGHRPSLSITGKSPSSTKSILSA
ncbi:uncharacterized protein BJ171DRAFT_97751 [Polychytrium aggregatum]|uniref:uncharacterized protein n=1 Tax=Polychytrium aggregatum TaxID=110093 RepID=UPI0022FEB707|nr:uncharacterized protein BJ171DRAFT_97751 [Polychytrium aggregatum]KAI9204554.1 hypothetical protein BJ171DRAFT_97751 [Polychytrium aggregatum]